MRKNYQRLLTLVFLLLVSSASCAELFKWVDEKGKVHYSDKKPDKEVKTKVVPVTKNVMSSDGTQESYSKAIIRPYERTARKLFLTDTLYSWRKSSEGNKKRRIGAYYAGKGCTSRGAMKVPDAIINHKGLFPSESENPTSIRKIINSLDYEASRSTKYNLLANLKKTGGLSLHSEIVNLDFNTCASSLRTRERLINVSKISSYKFNKHRIKLSVRWLLKTNRDQDVLYDITTHGSYNGWSTVASAKQAFAFAIEDATIKLFSDQSFIDKVLVEEDRIELQSSRLPGLNPVKSSTPSRTRPLYLSLNNRGWLNKLEPGVAVGHLLFGDRCSARKKFTMADASRSHQWLLSNSDQSVHALTSRIHSLGYSVKPATGDMLSTLKASGGYSLQAEIVDLAFEGCAPSLSAASKYVSTDKISNRKFTRNKLTVTIKWSLKTERNLKTIFISETQGIAGSLLTDNQGPKVLNDAMVAAAEGLFSDSTFIAKITRPINEPASLASFSFSELPSVKAPVRPKDSDARKLFLVVQNEVWNTLDAGGEIGIYAYGVNCTPYQTKKWPDALNQHPAHFSKASEFVSAQAQVLKSLDYDHQTTDLYNVLKLIRKTGGYSLRATVRELRYDSCAPEISDPERFNRSRKISSSQFKRHRARVNIHWRLTGASPDNILFETNTEGSANSWLLNTKAKNLLNMAVQQATEKLFSEKRFLNLILENNVREEKKGFFSNLLSFGKSNSDKDLGSVINNKFVLKSHLSQAFVDLSQVKVMVTQYYLERGEWPYSLSDLGLSDSNYASSKSIADLSVQSDGSIIAVLQDIFGPDKILQLSPDVDSNNSIGGLSWQCSSNLAKDYLPVNCETF